jgi:lysophospholipase L1-like esterase
MKQVMLLGDSICIGYRPCVREALAGFAEVSFPEENGRWAAFTYNSLRFWLTQLPAPDVIHFNNGIWDIVRLYGEHESFTAVGDYHRDILRTYRELKKLCVPIIFATTTPSREDTRIWDSDVRQYNAAAAEALRHEGCIINDLHALVTPHVDEWVSADGIHLTDEGYRACAEAVARSVTQAINL